MRLAPDLAAKLWAVHDVRDLPAGVLVRCSTSSAMIEEAAETDCPSSTNKGGERRAQAPRPSLWELARAHRPQGVLARGDFVLDEFKPEIVGPVSVLVRACSREHHDRPDGDTAKRSASSPPPGD